MTTCRSRCTGSAFARPGTSRPPTALYWYVLDDEKVTVAGESDDLERVERTVLEVAAGINDQDFEPRPDFQTCSWCDCPSALPRQRGLSAEPPPGARFTSPSTPLGSVVLAAQEVLEVASDRVPGGNVLWRGRRRRPAGPRAARPSRGSPGWRRRPRSPDARTRPRPARDRRASSGIPISPSSRRNRARAAFGLGTAAA